MKKQEIIILMCHEICEDLHIDRTIRSQFFSYFYAWSFDSYNEIEKEIKNYISKNSFYQNWEKSYSFLVEECEYSERLDIYTRLFDIFSSKIKNKKAPLILKEAYEKLKIKELDMKAVRDKFYKSEYYDKCGLRDYSNAVVFSLLIAYSNDDTLDEEEFEGFRKLLEDISQYMPQLPINSFDIKNFLSFNDYTTEDITKLKEELMGAMKSDGVVDNKELHAIKRIAKAVHIGEESSEHLSSVAPYLSLFVLLSDDVITSSEEKWFFDTYGDEFVVSKIDHVFWLSKAMVKIPLALKNNSAFFKKLWNRDNPIFDMTNLLFLTFAKHFLRLEDKNLKHYIDFISDGATRNVKESIKEIVDGNVVEEEILLIINLVLNKRYDLDSINTFLSKDYISRVFKGIKKDNSKLKYLAICNILFADYQVCAGEYSILWEAFKSEKLEPEILKSVIYDYNLCEHKIHEMDEYHRYLGN